MRKNTTNRQRALDLGVIEVPLDLMREAYYRCRINVSFERSLDLPHLRIGLRNVAIAMLLKDRRSGAKR